jgi:RNA polymerase sigma-70 factor (ECF subfamily)
VFLTYQPYLRMLVRRMLPNTLRPKFDSMDVVQSVWTDLVRGFREAGWRFSSAAQLRAFLVKVTRNRFIDRIRQNHAATEHQRSLETIAPELIVAPEESPSETVEADELWERMLALCPPAHRRLLELKRQGCSLAEIAQQTGLHESSVRRILYDLARRLAVERD